MKYFVTYPSEVLNPVLIFTLYVLFLFIFINFAFQYGCKTGLLQVMKINPRGYLWIFVNFKIFISKYAKDGGDKMSENGFQMGRRGRRPLQITLNGTNENEISPIKQTL